MLDPQVAEQLPGERDPLFQLEIAHQTARAILARCRQLAATDSLDSAVVDRLVNLVETEGLETVAEVWAAADAVSLPGALWRLYLVRQCVRQDPESVQLFYRLGATVAPVAVAVVGVVDLPTPTDLTTLVDAVLSGFFAGDLAAALERTAAFCRVLASGAALEADSRDQANPEAALRLTRYGVYLQRTANELHEAAAQARAGVLE